MIRKIRLIPLETVTLYSISMVKWDGVTVSTLWGVNRSIVQSFLLIPLRRGYSRVIERIGEWTH